MKRDVAWRAVVGSAWWTTPGIMMILFVKSRSVEMGSRHIGMGLPISDTLGGMY